MPPKILRVHGVQLNQGYIFQTPVKRVKSDNKFKDVLRLMKIPHTSDFVIKKIKSSYGINQNFLAQSGSKMITKEFIDLPKIFFMLKAFAKGKI